ncbi:MAG: peptidylprolyl isomerase [Elusimicrobia bacterium]|nr:peptidylprolyl isomerase [Elusimicrobiota bacterium]
MNNSSKAFLAAALLAAPGAAQAKVMEDTVAVVNGTPVLLSDYQKEMNEVLDYWRKAMPAAAADPAHLRKLKEGTLEQLIDREILFQEGSKLKLKVRERDIDNGVAEVKERFAKDDEGKALSEAEAEAAFRGKLSGMGLNYAQFRERLSRQIMARKVVDENVRARLQPPAETEVRAYFDRIKAYNASGSSEPPKGMAEDEAAAFMEIAGQIKAMSSERVRVSRVLFRFSPAGSSLEKKRALEAAQAVRRTLQDGTVSFADAARERSEEAEYASRGGDIGYLVRGVAPPEFEKAAFTLAVGEISEPIETDIGYFILRVQEKRAPEAPEFDKFKDELARALTNISFQKELESYVKGLKAQAVIERNLPTL